MNNGRNTGIKRGDSIPSQCSSSYFCQRKNHNAMQKGGGPHFVLCLAVQSCPTLWDPVDYSLPGSSCPWGFSRQDYWSELPCPPPGDLPNPGIKPRFPTVQAASLPSEPPGKPKNTEVGFSGDLSYPGIEPGSPALQADSLPAELPRKPIFFIGLKTFSFLLWSFLNKIFRILIY